MNFIDQFSFGFLRVLIATVGFAGTASTALGQSFVNGGFETPVIATNQWAPQPAGWGWVGQYNVGIANGNGSWGTGAHSGKQYGYVESDGIDFPDKQGWMQQTISGFTVGDSYAVSFWMAARNGDVGGNTSNPVEILLNGSTVLMAPTTSPVAWTSYTTVSFTATSASNTIRFQTTQTGVDSANLLDDVSIVRTAVPEPSSLLALGASALFLLKSRRKTKVRR